MFSAIKGAIEAVAHEVGHEFHIDASNKIYVTLSQPSYVGGDVVGGTVELDCLVPFFAKGVVLKVKGFERVWWEYTYTEWQGEGQDRRAVTKTGEHKENKEFFREVLYSVFLVTPHLFCLNVFTYFWVRQLEYTLTKE